MLAEQSCQGYLDGGLSATCQSLKHDVQGVRTSSNFTVSPQIDRQLGNISNGVDHIILDQEFLRSSKGWGEKFDSAVTSRQAQDAALVLQRAGDRLQGVKADTSTQRIQGQADYLTHQGQHRSSQNLQGIQQEMDPHVRLASDRVRQFCDHIGVTDRYTGYRNNLNRGNLDPTHKGFSWLDNKEKNAYNGMLNVGWRPGTTREPVRSASHTQQAQMSLSKSAPPQRQMTEVERNMALTGLPNKTCMGDPHYPVSRSIQEQCGINMTYPGRTEYMHRYEPTTLNKTKPGYHINPIPDFYMYDRPMARLYPPKCATEFQTRYEWPDGSKITKLPWLRK